MRTIETTRLPRWIAIGLGAMLSLAVTPLSEAAEVCFTTFGGGTHVQFKTTATRLKAAGEKALVGRIFGGLAPCAGLNQWPLTGVAIASGNQIILGFRASTVDAAGCGAVDYIVNLDATSLSGPLQLHNDRNNGSNTSTLNPAACANPFGEGEPSSLAGEDPNGNIVP